MKVKSIISAFVSLGVMTLFGCGGGGGSSSPAPPPVGSITIGGVAAMGPLNGADVTVFAVDNITHQLNRTPIAAGKTATDGSGKYSINITAPVPAGAVVIEVSGATYTDEASGTANVALSTHNIRAIVSAVHDGDKIAVTPFTEIAYDKAEGIGTAGSLITFTTSSIDDSNSSISKTFGIDNIITTLPFDPTNASLAATATAAQKKYSGALGSFSQLSVNKVPAGTVTTAATLNTATTNLFKDLDDQFSATGGINQTTLDSYNTAAATFSSSAKNQTGTTVSLITFSAGVLTISTAGVLPVSSVANVINGIDFTLTLPAGVTVAADVTGASAAGVIEPSSGAVSNSVVISKYVPATPATASAPATPGTVHIVITNVQPGFGVGEFTHINFLGFPTGLKKEDFKLAFNGDGVFGGVTGGTSTAALTGITLLVTNFAGL